QSLRMTLIGLGLSALSFWLLWQTTDRALAKEFQGEYATYGLNRGPGKTKRLYLTDGAPPRGDAVHGEETTAAHGGGIEEARGPTRRGHRGPTTTTTPSHTRGPRTPTATGARPQVRHARRAAARGRGVHSLSGDSGSPPPRFSPCARPPPGQ